MSSDTSSSTHKHPQTSLSRAAALLVFAVVALTSHSRAAEIPFAVLALSVIYFLWRDRSEFLRSRAIPYLLALFACYWLPMLMALPDALDFEKSMTQTLVSLRFPLAVMSMLYLVREVRQLQWIYLCTALLVAFWALDALIQQWLGVDLFGLPDAFPRLSGVFASDYLRLGLYSALLLPFLLHLLLQSLSITQLATDTTTAITKLKSWHKAGLILAIGLVLLTIWLSGTRSGWIIAGIGLAGAAVPLWRLRHEIKFFWLIISAMLTMATVSMMWSYQYVPQVKQRIEQTWQLTSGDFSAVNDALSYRLPIWQHAWAIAKEHPINGVGPRGFRIAYQERAAEDDYFLRKEGGGASHAHQLQLAIVTETGLIGLLAFLFGCYLVWRSWCLLPRQQRCLVAPPALALLVTVFPLNSHLDAYASSAALIFWWLLGLYLVAWQLAQAEVGQAD